MLSTQQGQRPSDRDTTDVPCFGEDIVNPASRCTCTASTTEANRAWPSPPEAPDERTGFADYALCTAMEEWDHENGHRAEEFTALMVTS
jgi:hypothetical protein